MSKTRQLQLFLTPEDEAVLSSQFLSAIPDLIFLDDSVWPVHPVQRPAIQDCVSGFSYLYPGDIDALPRITRKDGQMEGPISGCVVQFWRPTLKGTEMRSGRIASGIESNDARMSGIVNTLFKIVRKYGTIGVVRPDGDVDKNYLVGKHARELAERGDIVLVDGAVGMPYTPL